MLRLNKSRVAAAAAVLFLLPALGGTEPIYRWSFDQKPVKPNWIPYFPSTQGNRIFTSAKVADGAVYPGQPLTGKPAYIAAKLPGKLGHRTSTWVIRFSPDSRIGKPMALLTYAEHGWGQGLFGVYLTPDSKIKIQFFLPKENPAVKYVAYSPRQEFLPGAQYTLQVTIDRGTMDVFLNGKAILERKNAPTLASFTVPFSKYFPVITIGCTNERNRPEQQFQGSISSIEYYAAVPEVPENSGSSNSLNILKVSREPVIDGCLDEALYSKASWTSPFLVFEKESAVVNGVWESADPKFVKNAAKATTFTDGKYLYVAFKAFFPADTPPDDGDSVEFFLRPDGKTTWQIITNVRNKSDFYYYVNETAGNSPWKDHGIKTAAKIHKDYYAVEMAIPLASFGCKALPAAGTAWRGNFARSGKSCGGLSAWAPVGDKFFTPSVFGYFLHGTEKDYFNAEVKQICAEFSSIADVAAKADELRKAVQAETRVNFEKITRRLDNLRRFAVKKLNSGKSTLIWRHDPWSDFGPDLRIPVIEELKTLRMNVPRGARAIGSFIISNLTDRHNMVTLQCGGNRELIHRIRYREGGFIQMGKRVFPDAVFNLPIGEVVRLAPESSGLIWVDIDTKGLKPGEYNGWISIVPAYLGFGRRTVRLSLRVSKVDLAEVSIPLWNYGVRSPRVIELLKDYDFNTTSLQATSAGPNPDKDGKYVFTDVDREIGALLENGIPLEEIRLCVYVDVRYGKIRLPDGKSVSFTDPGWKEEYAKRMLLFRDYVKTKYNIGYDRIYFYIIDEPNGDPNKAGSHAWYAFRGAEFFKSVDPRFRIFCNPWRIGDGTDRLYIAAYDDVAPCLPRLRPQKQAVKLYEKSRARVWTYSVLSKGSSPLEYRRMAWFHMAHGFRGTPLFYDLFDFAGDQFFSHDTRPGNSRITSDYGAVYRNSLWTSLRHFYPEKIQFNVSRRLEAWYLGIIDFKVSEYCRNKIAALKARGVDTAAFEREFAALAAQGAAPDGDMNKASAGLLNLAEKLAGK